MREAVLITGGAKRIGRELALFLANQDFDVAITYNSSHKSAESLKSELQNQNVRCEIFRADLNSEKDLLNLIPAVLQKFSNLSILINNASIFRPAPIRDTSPEIFDSHISTNLKAPFFLSKDFSNNAKNGQIINILDTRIASSRTSYASYSLSKKALADFTKMAATEFAPNIRVNGIAPGLILPPEGKDEKYLEELAKHVPLKRKGSVDNIKSATKFLLDNDYITGQIIFCDGGEYLKRT